MNRADIIQRILAERERQFNLPGREFDVHNSVNDWTAIIGHYLFDAIRRGAMKPQRCDFEDSLVKAAAVMVAALEHCLMMEELENFSQHFSLDSD